MSRDALVVGINTYTNLNSLKAPATDAEAIAQRLAQDGEFRVRRLPEAVNQNDKSIYVGKSIQVSLVELQKALVQLFKPESRQAPDTALFYFSGHGIRTDLGVQEGFLATSDISPEHGFYGLSLRWLRRLLEESPVKQQIVWLDCCHSGELLNFGEADPGDRGKGRDRCFIAASREFEAAYEEIAAEHSVLTRALLDGLDPSQFSDRCVTNLSLTDFINEILKREIQTPICNNSGEAIYLTRLQQAPLEKVAVSSPTDICPYKGLAYFDCNDEDFKYFYGRRALTDELLNKVRQSNFLAIVGASGSGKSSALRAGLLYQIKQGRRIFGSDQWDIRIMVPGEKPDRSLAAAFIDNDVSRVERAEQQGRAEALIKEGADGLRRLVQTAAGDRVILVIDQFEEVFTLCKDIEEREQFFACLMGILSETDNKLCLIITMRADFVGKCLERDYSGLAQRVQQGMVSVLPMSADELRSAICKPAEQEGLTVEPTLVTEILNDIAGAPGSLPLLQYTLKELWQRRENNQMVLSAYQALGGINGTLDRRATEIYHSFDEAEQRTVQHIFQQLTQIGEGTEDTRRRVALQNLIAEAQHPAQRVNQVVATLSAPDNRLLVTSEVVSKGKEEQRMAIVDVAHEALIRHWQLLRQWIEQNRDLLRQQRRIEASAEAWQEHQQSKGYLLQGLPLIEALQFQKQQADTFPLSEPAKTFIHRSVRQQRWNRAKTASWLIIPAAIVVGVVEYNLREQSIKDDYGRLDSASKSEEKQAVESLVAGCPGKRAISRFPTYWSERLFGNCRSLYAAALESANLSSANLSSANLSFANLSFANLSSANLIFANLSDADLRSVNIRSANLSSADLRSTNLSSAILIFANLSSADLSSANLSSADLSSANLSSADLSSANLSDATLNDADLSDADLSSASLSDANFILTLRSTNLRSASLRSANLHSANLHSADLRSADLRSASLRSANLSSASLSDANLSDANLSSAILGSANLSDANLSRADLSSASLSDANLSRADLSSASLGDANLSDANLSDVFLLATDLRTVKNLKAAQLKGKSLPYLCNTALPPSINDIDPNRDCDALPKLYSQRYSIPLENAKRIINKVHKKKW